MSPKFSEAFHRSRFLVTSSKEVTEENLCYKRWKNKLITNKTPSGEGGRFVLSLD